MEPLVSYGNFLKTSLMFYNANVVNEPLQFNARDLKDLFEALNQAKVRYMLVRGFALAFHGYLRGTVDLDVWVDESEDNKAAIAKSLEQIGIADGASFRLGSEGFEVDMMDNLFLFKASSFNTCYHLAADASIMRVPFKVLSKNDLIKEKESTGRPKDADDAKQLRSRS